MVASAFVWIRASLVAAAVLAVGVTSPVTAARPSAVGAPGFALLQRLHSPYVMGGGPLDNAFEPVTVKHRRDGRLLASVSTQVNDVGIFYAKVKPVEPGDRLVITVGDEQRSIIAPDLRLNVDLQTDTITGHVPMGTLTAEVFVSDQVGTFVLGGDPFSVGTGPNGRFELSTTGERDLTGADDISLNWSDPATGDGWSVFVTMPAVQARVGRAGVWLFGRYGQDATATLRSSGGALRARATARVKPEFESVAATFRSSGHPVKGRAGDVITLSTSAGMLKLRTPDLQVSGGSGGSLSATCFKDRDFVAGILGSGGSFSYLANGSSESDGSIDVAPLRDTDLPSGTRVMLLCENAAGFTQELVDTVP